jgi:hypothetical protein
LGVSRECLMSASSIPNQMSPCPESDVDKYIGNSDVFSLTNPEHKMILQALEDECAKPFILKNKYYMDEENTMITGYISKTRLKDKPVRIGEDKVFESLIKGVGRMKSLRIILDTVYKDLKSASKSKHD